MSREIAEEYASSLADLTVNSKPLINMLTILAEENIAHAGTIVEVVEKHLEKVKPQWKLPVLYLIDSIIKNVGRDYKQKFAQVIVNMFTKTFKAVDEKTRSDMFKLRETWHEVFPEVKLYQLDVKVNMIDHAWPICAQPPQSKIHVNPNFLKKPATGGPTAAEADKEEDMRLALAKKEQELLLLQRKKNEMEQAKKQLEENMKRLQQDVVKVSSATGQPVEMTSTTTPKVAMPVSSVHIKDRPPVMGKPPTPLPRIAPAGAAIVSSLKRQDPRLMRMQASNVNKLTPNIPPPPEPIPISQLFDAKPVERRKNAITIDVQPAIGEPIVRDPRDPRLQKRRNHNNANDVRNDNEEQRLRAAVLRKGKRSDRENKRVGVNIVKKDTKAVDREEKTESPSRTQSENPTVSPLMPDPKKVKLPPIPKLSHKNKERSRSKEISPTKRKSESNDSQKKAKKRKSDPDVKTSPKKSEKVMQATEDGFDLEKPTSEEVVTFKELKTQPKTRNYMKRNKEKSPSPVVEVKPIDVVCDKVEPRSETTKMEEVVGTNKDVDLRMLTNKITDTVVDGGKRASSDNLESASKKNKFDVLFGDEDVDLRTLPVRDELTAPPPPIISEDIDEQPETNHNNLDTSWTNIKVLENEDPIRAKTKLDAVRAKLVEAAKGKDRLGRPLLFSEEQSEKRKTTSEDTDMRNTANISSDKEAIKIIMNQAEEQYKAGDINKDQYNHLVLEVLKLNEIQKLNEAKQKESLEVSKRKLQKISRKEQLSSDEETSSPKSNFGDIDERVVPVSKMSPRKFRDSDLRVPPLPQPNLNPNMTFSPPLNEFNPKPSEFGPGPPEFGLNHPELPSQMFGPQHPRFLQPIQSGFKPSLWRHPAGILPARAGYGGRGANRPPFEPRGRLPRPQFNDKNPPIIGSEMMECPFEPYVRFEQPPPLGGTESKFIPPTNFRHLDYIRNDTVKTIDIDGIPREIRFYGYTAVIMLGWDDPREIKFLTMRRKITFNNADSYILMTNDEYKTVNIGDEEMIVKIGHPTRELFINEMWFTCYFGGNPFKIALRDQVHTVHLEGPPPKVDIGAEKRLDLVAGKINLIVDATNIYALFLDAKPQIFEIRGIPLVIRFVDSFETVLINEKPFSVEYGGLPKPIYIGRNKHFIRFSVLPPGVKPGKMIIAGMEGRKPQLLPPSIAETMPDPFITVNEDVQNSPSRNLPNADSENSNGVAGLDMLASAIPTTPITPSIHGGYSLNPGIIPGLDAAPIQSSEPGLSTLNIDDLFAKLVASGIVKSSQDETNGKKAETKAKEEDKHVIKPVNLLKTDTLRQRQPGVVWKLYGGMQCSGCGVRFPPEHTVRYSQHLDWHFRQNRRDRDSARRAHSRNWHYDLSDWIQYEEIEDLEEREKSWFENQAVENQASVQQQQDTEEMDTSAVPVSASCLPHQLSCALCGDRFYQYFDHERDEWKLKGAVSYNEDNYHPGCLAEVKSSEEIKQSKLESSEMEPAESVTEPKEEESDTTAKMEIDDDVIMEVLPRDEDSDSDIELLEPGKDEPEIVMDDEEVESKLVEEPEKAEEAMKDEEPSEPVPSEAEPSEVNPSDAEPSEPLEIPEDDDDVVLNAEPVEEILVEDCDTDDETEERRKLRDANLPIRPEDIKKEKVDLEDEPVVTAEEEALMAPAHTSQNAMTSSIDGNANLPAPLPTQLLPASTIKINIAKQTEKLTSHDIASSTPPPASEEEALSMEQEPTFTYKESMKEISFVKRPPVKVGTELSGLCSIM